MYMRVDTHTHTHRGRESERERKRKREVSVGQPGANTHRVHRLFLSLGSVCGCSKALLRA